MNQLRQTIDRAAKANSRILIVGPSGSGKELAARTLHNASGRAEGPFTVINAAAITPERLEVELFGIEQSNGEQVRKPGALEEAHGGTLFIDEIADMPRETQNKILRVLVDQTFQRSGGTAKIHVDVRIISSTARNLEEEIAAGRFREDLYHRLSVVPIRVPPLSERREDIPELIDYFIDKISAATGLPKRQIGQDAMAVLQSHVWPGNVRQLRNNVERVHNSGRRRPGSDHHRRHAAAGRWLHGTGDADQQQWRAHHGLAATGGAGSVRARLPDRADQSVLGQHFAHRRIRRHGALGATPQAEGASGWLRLE